MTHARIRAVVVGCGFAGLAAARVLAAAEGIELTVFNRRPGLYNYPVLPRHLVEPQPEVVVAPPLAPYLPGVQLRTERVEAIDTVARRIETAAGPVPYDFLVVAVGARARTLPRGERTPLVFPKSSRHLARLRADLARLVDTRAAGRVCIVGGGLTGVEFAAAVRAYIDREATRRGRGTRGYRVVLLERGPHLAPDCPPALAVRIARSLAAAGVEVRTGCEVRGIEGRRLDTAAGALEADLTLCCAGSEADLRLPLAGLEAGPDGVACDGALVADSGARVLAAGDAVRPDGIPVRALRRASHARIQGRLAARNLLRLAVGAEPQPYRPRPHPVAVYLGPGRGLVGLGPLAVGGRAGATLKRRSERRTLNPPR